ncbi:MAG: adenylate/guanylate cyclase domain-containing protein [Campylobacterota bacterium]|nr:adenylate/guanylate cyclase domain-containing protein [Campylobacterota bacterium]
MKYIDKNKILNGLKTTLSSSKQTIKKFFLYSFVAVVIATFISIINIFYSTHIETFDNKLRDYMFQIRGEIPHNNNVVIIDLDEKSLNSLGQWPWPRDKFAKILENLTDANIGVIGLDIVFAEIDQSSPAKVFKDLNMDNSNVPDFDEILDNVVSSTPTILGYQFELNDKKFMKKEEIDIPAIIVERDKQEGQELLINAKGTVLNHKKLQESGYSSGFFNNIPDSSGVIRSVPLVIKYEDQIYPSLSLEIVRVATGINNIFVNYSELGIESIQIGDFFIPTDRHGRFIVNFRGPSHTFKYYSAIDIYNNNFDPKELDGKVALIGTTAAGLNDLRAMPFEPVYPGVEVHANIIDNILTGDFLSIPSWIDGVNIIILFIISILTVLLVTYTAIWINPFVMTLMITSFSYFAYYILFYHGIVLNLFIPLTTIIIATLITTFMDYFFEIKQEQMIKKKFASKVSSEVMENLLLDPTNDAFTAMEKEVTVFFSDVRGFTNISEAMPNAHTLIKFLNEYMDPMTDIIIKEKGTVDKFIGDAIMAYWNAPGEVPDHANAAVRATLNQLYMIEVLNKKLKNDERFNDVIKMSKEKGVPLLDIGIGLNTGEVVVGEMGSTTRSDYTIIGDPVNLGARLESLCKFYGSKCNISNFTKWQLTDDFIFRFLDIVIVKGQSKPVQIWQVIDYDRDETFDKLYNVSRERLDEELFTYHRALDLYQNGNFSDALEIFKEVNEWEDKTNLAIYNIYIDRCEHYIEFPPEDFDGVFRHTTKG